MHGLPTSPHSQEDTPPHRRSYDERQETGYRGRGLQSALQTSEDIATLPIQGRQAWQGTQGSSSQAWAPVNLTVLLTPLSSWSQHEAQATSFGVGRKSWAQKQLPDTGQD